MASNDAVPESSSNRPPLFIRLSLPGGLETALESLAREVLRSQPKDIYKFAAEHFEEQLRQRNKEQGFSPDHDLEFFAPKSHQEEEEFGGSKSNDEHKKEGDGTLIESLSGRASLGEEEENDVGGEDEGEMEAAATKIQAGFRGSQARKEVQEKKKKKKEIKDERPVSSKGRKAIEIQMPTNLAATGMDVEEDMAKDDDEEDKTKEEETVDEAKEEDVVQNNEEIKEEEVDIDLEDPEVEKAATKIQAGYKGMRTRKEVKVRQEIVENRTNVPKSLDEFNRKVEDEIVDIDLNDPDVEKAATTIQSGYKGMRTRKEVKEKRKQKEGEQAKVEDDPVNEEEVKEEEEEIDIDLEDPETEKAATKIQAGFRGHQARKEVKEKMDKKDEADPGEEKVDEEIDIDLDDPEVEQAATKIQAGFKGHKARKEMKAKKTEVEEDTNDKEEEEAVDIDLEDPEVAEAATKIQAGYKGYKTRKGIKSKEEEAGATEEAETEANKEEEEEIDIDLEDPEVEAAATKIQAGFKGHKARKEMKEKKDQDTAPEEDKDVDKEEEIDIDLNDPEVEAAATKIQAGFKGHQARKEIKSKKTEDAKEEVEEPEAKEEEEVDIDLTDPEVEMAASRIQAGYKGYKVRKGIDKKDENEEHEEGKKEENKVDEEEIYIDLDDPDVEKAATKIQAGFKGHKTRKEMKDKKEEKAEEEEKEEDNGEEIDIDLTDPEVEAAATKIQAGFKGHQTRKEMKKKKTGETKDGQEKKEVTEAKEDEEIDIDLTDPEVEQAATKIQAGFKGHKARKEMREKKDETSDQAEQEEEKQEEVDIDLEDPEVEIAATKIQAGYKGMKTRNEMKNKDSKANVAEAGQANEEETVVDKKEEEEVVDIDLEDPDVADAATKIQAGYRGMRARQDLAESQREDKEAVLDPDDPEVMGAATTIQAGFKGMQARRHAQSMREHRKRVLDGGAIARDVVAEAVDIDLDDPEVGEAATKIQAGYKGMRARKEVQARRLAKEENEEESLTIISEVRRRPVVEEEMVEVKVADSGAIPFELHPSAQGSKDEEEEEDAKKDEEVTEQGEVSGGGGGKLEAMQHHQDSSSSLDSSLVKSSGKTASGSGQPGEDGDKNHSLMIYHYRGSHNSQKVMVYLAERGITDFTAYHVDLQRNENLSTWFLELNPKGEVPVAKLEGKIVADSTRIIHLLEAKIPVNDHPALVPCTSDTRLYQKHVYFTALIDQLPVNQLTHGLAFHPEFALCRSAPPYDDPEHLKRLKDVLENGRAVALRQAAEEAEGACNMEAMRDLRDKAQTHEEEYLPKLKDVRHFEALLEQTAATLDKVEEQLEETASEAEVEFAWLLGKDFSAVDISLAVAMNRLAQLGLQRLWVNCEDRRPRVEMHLREAQTRASFEKTIPELGFADGKPHFKTDTAATVGDSGAGMSEEMKAKGAEDALKRQMGKVGTDDSIDVWRELERGISVKEEE